MKISPLMASQRWLFLLSVLFLWPTCLNGVPFFFSDTTGYIRSADAVVFKLSGHATPWSDVIARADAPASAVAPVAAQRSSFAKNVIIGRSIFYGLIVYSGVLLGSLMVPVLLQAGIAGAVLLGSVRHIADPEREPVRFRRLTLAAFGVAALTALPYFVGFLMPDVFAGTAVLAAVVLITGWRREPLVWRLFWVAVLCLGALVHSSIVLVLVGMAAIGAILWLPRPSRAQVSAMALACVLVSAGVGVAGETGFKLALGAVLHRPPIRPPFLAMRLISDGPGAAYLHDTCPQSGFTLCAYRGRPAATSDVLLWSGDPRVGVFTTADAPTQRRIAEEHLAFSAAVVARYPAWVAATTLRNIGLQLRSAGLSEFHLPILADPEVAGRIPAAIRARIRASAAEQGRMPIAPYRVLVWVVTLASLALLLRAVRRGGWPVGAWVALLLGGIIVNGVVCGGLSLPADRYMDRVIWLIPIAALFFWREASRPARR